MKLIERESIGSALRYGWSELPRYLRRFWWLTILAIVVAVYVDWKVAMYLSTTIYVVGAAIPAMIYLSKQRAGKNPRDLVVLGLLFAALTLAVHLVFISKIGPAMSNGRYMVSVLLSLFVNWLWVKLVATIPMYMMQSKSSVASAYAASWRFVSGGTWWRLLIILLAGELPYGALHAVVWSERFTLVQSGALFPAVAVLQVLAIVGWAWSSLATVALVSTTPTLVTE